VGLFFWLAVLALATPATSATTGGFACTASPPIRVSVDESVDEACDVHVSVMNTLLRACSGSAYTDTITCSMQSGAFGCWRARRCAGQPDVRPPSLGYPAGRCTPHACAAALLLRTASTQWTAPVGGGSAPGVRCMHACTARFLLGMCHTTVFGV